MEKKISLNYEEATAILEMALFSYLDNIGGPADSALRKLGELCRKFYVDDPKIDEADPDHKKYETLLRAA